jgi:hypothetical protein
MKSLHFAGFFIYMTKNYNCIDSLKKYISLKNKS